MAAVTKGNFIISLLVIFLAGVIFWNDSAKTYFLNYLTFGKISSEELNMTKESYAVIFDAGSTGSRMHIFHFKEKDGSVEVLNELFMNIKPGLSAFANNPVKGAHSLLPMLEQAVRMIPTSLKASTVLTLKATAGLRLLSQHQAGTLLNEVLKLFQASPFLVSEDSIEILDSDHEGIYSWITVNYLLGAFSHKHQMVAALDLGGGSTQLTFIPRLQETFNKIPVDDFANLTIFNQKFHVYTRSYLGLGLKAARYEMMEKKAGNSELSSICLPPGHDFIWEHDGNKFKMSGKENRESRFESCYEQAKRLVTNNMVGISELQDLPLYAFSYYYECADEAQLINESSNSVSVRDFRDKGIKVCSEREVRWPFACIDVVYIYALLHDGFLLPDDIKIHITKKINQFEVSWALGVAFQLLSSAHLLS